MTQHPTASHRSLRRHLVAGLVTLLVLGGGMGGWAATTQLAGAVVAPGLVVVDGHVKKVQHPTGGVVGEIRVREGSSVKAGDLVVRLDETVTRANLAVITKALDELAARLGRLEAERDGLNSIRVSPVLADRDGEREVKDLIAGEQRLFELRREARNGLRAQLKERVDQLEQQISGLQLQSGAKGEEAKLIEVELKGVQELYSKNLIPISRVTALRREQTRLRGEQGQLIASIAQAKGRISETELQILQIDQDLRGEVAKELRELQGKSAELLEKRVAAEDLLKRIDIRAPFDGVVHQLAVHTVGGVIAPGDVLMLVVPQTDDLAIEVKIEPKDIDQLSIGQEAVLRMSAFNQRTTPEIRGRVSRIAADLTQDKTTGASYFSARVTTDAVELGKLRDLKLVPGMPVEVFIKTRERSALSYLMRPLADQMMRAFRGD
jgi:HlyD family secretion protein